MVQAGNLQGNDLKLPSSLSIFLKEEDTDLGTWQHQAMPTMPDGGHDPKPSPPGQALSCPPSSLNFSNDPLHSLIPNPLNPRLICVMFKTTRSDALVRAKVCMQVN
jgi:hypothetical protein